jgi:hypothetical protein
LNSAFWKLGWNWYCAGWSGLSHICGLLISRGNRTKVPSLALYILVSKLLIEVKVKDRLERSGVINVQWNWFVRKNYFHINALLAYWTLCCEFVLDSQTNCVIILCIVIELKGSMNWTGLMNLNSWVKFKISSLAMLTAFTLQAFPRFGVVSNCSLLL